MIVDKSGSNKEKNIIWRITWKQKKALQHSTNKYHLSSKERNNYVIQSTASSLSSSFALLGQLSSLSSLFLLAVQPSGETSTRPWHALEVVREGQKRNSWYNKTRRYFYLDLGMYKDQIYFIGAIKILRNRHKINFHEFHCGKFSIDDYFKLR